MGAGAWMWMDVDGVCHEYITRREEEKIAHDSGIGIPARTHTHTHTHARPHAHARTHGGAGGVTQAHARLHGLS